jgi:hypothetical protein
MMPRFRIAARSFSGRLCLLFWLSQTVASPRLLIRAYHLSRKLQSQGHDARLMPAKVKIALLGRPVWFTRDDGGCEQPKENSAWFVWNHAHAGAPRIAYAVDSTRR